MDRKWTVMLIGGSSGTGKSTLARQIVQHYKIPLTETDDLRIAIQAVLDKNFNPDLFTFLTNPDYLERFSPDYFVKKLLDVGSEVWKPLNTLIDKHIACSEPVVFEGDSIIPRLLAQRDQDKIKAVFLYDDTEGLKDRMQNRNRGGNTQYLAEREAELSYAVGQEFKRQAEETGFPVIKSSPIETLFERAIKEIA